MGQLGLLSLPACLARAIGVVGIVFLLVASVTSVAAKDPDPRSGHFWVPLCGHERNSGDAICSAFVAGFLAGQDMMHYLRNQPSIICAPKGFTMGQGSKIIAKYLRDHPERLHEDFDILVASALIAAYRCPT